MVEGRAGRRDTRRDTAYDRGMSAVDRSYIRTRAMAVLLNPARTHHAVIRFTDTSTDPRHFHRLVGGGVELGERSVDAVVREIGEELGLARSLV